MSLIRLMFFQKKLEMLFDKRPTQNTGISETGDWFLEMAMWQLEFAKAQLEERK